MTENNPFDAALINPFVNAVVETFKKMLSSDVTRDKLSLATTFKNMGYYSSQIGMSGEVKKGVVILSVGKKEANDMTEAFLGMAPDDEEDVMDALGELVNIIAGGAKRQFADSGTPMKLSLPIVTGGAETVYMNQARPILQVDFVCPLGKFTILFQMEG